VTEQPPTPPTFSGELPTGGRVDPIDLQLEMQRSYLDYAISLLVGRALPHARDAPKPVHRRVRSSVHEHGLQPNRPYKKSANVVGAVMGNYHPHGDSAIYDTLVRMAQPFSLRYPLVDGQGNFGSVDDDSAAAMRYTECRLARIATEMLRDIDADTVDYVPNYDESRREPLTLPSRFPNLLVNGSSGIAVGMATNIPPHRLPEVVDAIVHLIDKPDANVDDLMAHVKGPDFPTGAYIIGRSGIRDAYRTGRGRIVMRARAHIEELRGGKSAVIVTELPYGVKKGGENGVITKIADLVNDKVLSEISDLQDHSDRTGMRIQIELKRDAIPNVALNKLFKHTQLQTTFGYNAVALVDGVPRTLSLLELVHEYLRYQRDVVTRRSKHELRRAEERAHVLQGYLIALDNLDEVIALIRGSADTDAARTGLQERFGLSEIQAQAILDLRLARLTGLARKEIEDEFADLQERIAELRAILGDPARIDALIREELLEIRDIYGKIDDRRTEIAAAEEELELEDLIAEEDMVIAITRSGYIKRLPVTTYREQRRGGIGVMGMELKDEDYIEHLFVASTHDFLLFFTSVGKIYRLKVHELPLGSRQSKGRAIVNLLPFQQTETIRAVIATRDFKDAEYLTAVTKKGLVKKTRFLEYNTPLKADGIIAIKLRDGDELVAVLHSSGEDDILMVSRKGQAIRFNEKLARPMGRATSGVTGMRLRSGDEVITADIARNDHDLLVVTENGFGKRTRIDQYPVKGRGGLGVKTVQLTEARGQLAGSLVVNEGDQVMLITTGGTVIKVPADGIKQSGRSTQGVIVMRLREGERVSTLARVVESDDDEAEGPESDGTDLVAEPDGTEPADEPDEPAPEPAA
jgi:DNA gyrase subunit A